MQQNYSNFNTEAFDDLTEFCGFNLSGENFFSKYVYHGKWKTLTPCGEFAFVTVEQLILLLLSIIHVFSLRHAPPLPTKAVRSIICFKIFTALISSVVLCVILGLSFLTKYHTRDIFVIEYSILAIVWFAYSLNWINSIQNNLWTRPFWLNLTYSITSKSFFMITVLRWLVYGFADPRTYLLLIIDAAHILNYIFNIVEWKIARNLNTFQQLQEETLPPLSDTADEDTNLFSRLFFCWVNPLIKKGYDGQLKTINDLFPLPPSLKVETIDREFLEAAPSYYVDAAPFSLPKSLFNAFGFQYLLLGILRFSGDCFSFAGPILLHYLVTELEDGDQKVS
uniref:Uncharacterized protein n=1 Tax=Panagrolaimus sp. PS1159 TaxID=55785 RepID=A0AC35FZR1_9BILA